MIVLAVLKSTVDWTTTVVTVLGRLAVDVDVPDERVEFGLVLRSTLASVIFLGPSLLNKDRCRGFVYLVSAGIGPEIIVVGLAVAVTVTVESGALVLCVKSGAP